MGGLQPPAQPHAGPACPGKGQPGPRHSGAGLEYAEPSTPQGLLPHLQPTVRLRGHPEPLKPLTAPPPSKRNLK